VLCRFPDLFNESGKMVRCGRGRINRRADRYGWEVICDKVNDDAALIFLLELSPTLSKLHNQARCVVG
jgi:hypothetical protein